MGFILALLVLALFAMFTEASTLKNANDISKEESPKLHLVQFSTNSNNALIQDQNGIKVTELVASILLGYIVVFVAAIILIVNMYDSNGTLQTTQKTKNKSIDKLLTDYSIEIDTLRKNLLKENTLLDKKRRDIDLLNNQLRRSRETIASIANTAKVKQSVNINKMLDIEMENKMKDSYDIESELVMNEDELSLRLSEIQGIQSNIDDKIREKNEHLSKIIQRE